jgi:hypothetical protein
MAHRSAGGDIFIEIFHGNDEILPTGPNCGERAEDMGS